MRSQFGPVMVSGDMSEVSLYLPGPRLLSYGMEQLVWAGQLLHLASHHHQQVTPASHQTSRSHQPQSTMIQSLLNSMLW